jgi:hypothetical protein
MRLLVGEARPVAVESAAETAATGHVELAVPVPNGQANFEIDRRPNVSEHAAVGREIRGRPDRGRRQ